MELTQLKYFKVVAETESFSKSATLLHITQPAVSKAIHNLEKELRLPLFDRDKNRLVLNDAGKIVLTSVNDILKTLNTMEMHLNSLKGTAARKNINVGAVHIDLFRHHLHRLTTQFPEITFQKIPLANTAEMENQLFLSKVDIGFSFSPIENDQIVSVPICRDQVLLRVPKSDLLASKDSVSFDDLEGRKVLVLSERGKSENNFIFREILNNSKISLMTESDPLQYMLLLNSNRYLSLSSALELANFDIENGAVFIPITEAADPVTHYLSYLKNNADAFEFISSWIVDDSSSYFRTYPETK